MTQEKIQMFMISNQKNFDVTQIPTITEKLQSIDDDKLMIISSANYKDPTIMLIVSLLLGGLGIDRFMLGDIGIGVLKLLTGGCFGVLTIIDWFKVISKTKQRNFEIFVEAINLQNTIQSSRPTNNIAEIKKLKELLDAGIISQEEFELKKKELL